MPGRCRRCSTATAFRPRRWPAASRAGSGKTHNTEETTMNIAITRRAALLGAAGLLATPAILRAQGQLRITLGHGAAPGNPRSLAAERLAALLKERSQGRIE